MLLTALVAELQSKIPARNNVPSAAQYQSAVLDAVLDFSLQCAREKISELAVVAGTATYDLPADFVKIIKLYSARMELDGVAITSNGLVPVNGINGLSRERHTISNRKITFYPTPTYIQTRTLRYMAGWALTGTGESAEYADLGDAEAKIVLLKAQAEAKTLLVNAEGGGVWAYRIGDESFDKSGGVQGMIAERDARLAEYQAACRAYNGPATVYGEYQP
ncbi:MAG TPA: hypothetical protein DCG54_07595 [Anaerolineae bacterium]|jgi:hypothetical protein|nr:hypothetical protein [Anaerolineae bacterium]